MGVTFECADLVFALGGNRLLFRRKAAASALPDYFLVVLSAEQFGTFDCLARDWKADFVQAIAVSQSGSATRGKAFEETVRRGATGAGYWQLRTGPIAERTRLELVEELGIG